MSVVLKNLEGLPNEGKAWDEAHDLRQMSAINRVAEPTDLLTVIAAACIYSLTKHETGYTTRCTSQHTCSAHNGPCHGSCPKLAAPQKMRSMFRHKICHPMPTSNQHLFIPCRLSSAFCLPSTGSRRLLWCEPTFPCGDHILNSVAVSDCTGCCTASMPWHPYARASTQ